MTIVRSVGAGNTVFTLLVPNVNVSLGELSITNLGITAMHRTTNAGIGRGQLTTYDASSLHRTASQVDR